MRRQRGEAVVLKMVMPARAASLHAAGTVACGHLRSAVLLLMVFGLRCVGGVPKVKQQLNVHGHKDEVREPGAATPAQVEKLYTAVLGRPVDEHGAAHYQSGKGFALVQVADELLSSMEFRSKYADDELSSKAIPVEYAQAAMFDNVLGGDVRVSELDLRYLYSRLFDRQPDEAALAAYKPIIEAKTLASESLATLRL